MKLIDNICNVMRKPERIPMNIIYRIPFIAKRISDENYLKFIYWCSFRKRLNLDNPKTFNEKLQWLKINDKKDIYTTFVDKFEVRSYIAEMIGEQYLIPLIGVWDKFEQIKFDELPNEFVLKCTHDSGGVVICKDKKNFNMKKCQKKIEKSLKRNFYLTGREWPYKNVTPRIIVEKYMSDNSQQKIKDYKFYCFNGEPKYLYVSQGMDSHSTAEISFFNMDFKEVEFSRKDYKKFKIEPKMPNKFEEMKKIAEKLSEGLDFIRVDLYEINDRIYFSELTLHPASGLMQFKPKKYDYILGDMLRLSKN